MVNGILHVSDTVSTKDSVDANVTLPSLKPGLWARTEVIGGYGDFQVNENGKSSLGEVIFKQKNIVPLGGVSYVMEKVFGVGESQIHIPTMYDNNKIGLPNSTTPTDTYVAPDGTNFHKKIIYRPGHFVSMFGVGITATAENDIVVYKPDYRENDIALSKVNTDGLTVTGTLLPFRYTTETLSVEERKMYFGKKKDSEGITGYYLKKFQSEPVIKHTWKTGEDYEDETLITNSEVWTNIQSINAVESFTEIFLKITKKDIKEIFNKLEQPDRARINTIALFNGEFIKDTSDPADDGDYRDVRLFSKLCIPTEMLSLNKDLNIIYRVYGA